MGLYTDPKALAEANEIEMNLNLDELCEAFFYDDHYSDSDEEKKALFENADVLMEAKKISRKTIVRLNKNDDLTRIRKKYANKAQLAARKGQRAYVSNIGATGTNAAKKMHPAEMAKTRA